MNDDGNNDEGDDGDEDESGILSSSSLSSSSVESSFLLLSSMAAPVSTDSSHPFHTPLKYWDIYVDDFCGAVQGNK